jgi:hypothetical protein
MFDDEPLDVVRRLLTTPPAEFVAARNATAKQLRKDGRKDAAAIVAGVRRLSLPDWALNVVAGEHPGEVGEFVAASDGVRDAQAAAIEGREGADVRTVLHELRDCTARLVTLARGVVERAGQTSTTASTGELTARLAQIAGNATAAHHLRAGLLGAEDAGTVDVFAGLVPSDRPARRAPSRPASKPPAGGRDAAPARRPRIRALADAERRMAAAGKASSAADAAVKKAAGLVDRTRRRFEQAEAELAEAEEHLAQAEQDRTAAAGELAAVEAAVAEARRDLGDDSAD